MGPLVVTTVDTTVPPEREQELLDGFRQLNEGDKPDGLLRSELLRGERALSGSSQPSPPAEGLMPGMRANSTS